MKRKSVGSGSGMRRSCGVSYMPCVTLADGVPVVIQLEEKDQFRLTPEKLLENVCRPYVRRSDSARADQPDA